MPSTVAPRSRRHAPSLELMVRVIRAGSNSPQHSRTRAGSRGRGEAVACDRPAGAGQPNVCVTIVWGATGGAQGSLLARAGRAGGEIWSVGDVATAWRAVVRLPGSARPNSAWVWPSFQATTVQPRPRRKA